MSNETEYLREIQQSIKQLAEAIVDEMITRGVGIGGSGGGGGGGDATAVNQTTTIERITEVRDRLPTTVASEATLSSNLGSIDSPVATAAYEYNADDNITTTLPWNIISLLKGILTGTVRIGIIQDYINYILNSINTLKDAFGTQNDSTISLSQLNSSSLLAIVKSIFQSQSNSTSLLSNSTSLLSDLSQQMLTSAIPVTPLPSAAYDQSGEINSTSSQVLFNSNLNRRYLFIQNQSETEDLWINFNSPATASKPSIRIPPLASFTQEGGLCFIDTITIIGTIGVPFTAKEGIVSISRYQPG